MRHSSGKTRGANWHIFAVNLFNGIRLNGYRYICQVRGCADTGALQRSHRQASTLDTSVQRQGVSGTCTRAFKLPPRHTVLTAEELADGGPQHRAPVGSARVGRQARPLQLQLPILALGRYKKSCEYLGGEDTRSRNRFELPDRSKVSIVSKQAGARLPPLGILTASTPERLRAYHATFPSPTPRQFAGPQTS